MGRVDTPASGWIHWSDGYTRACAKLARWCMLLSVVGMVALLSAVLFQVFGRHVLNNTPTWAESLSLLLVLYVTMMGAAVGVRDGTHIGFESLLLLVPAEHRRPLLLLVHALVLIFGLLMAWNCAVLAESVHTYKIPNLGLSEGWKYVPATIAGVLIILFSAEHIIAVLRNKKVEPSWR
ncbi:MAG: TRAP transporter small permease [Castellaniella sp.]|uniref:TRAP transporter small permease n=1 Tax=Castellaniella sp. TaxID=1955812 RepID=UPI003A89AE7E